MRWIAISLLLLLAGCPINPDPQKYSYSGTVTVTKVDGEVSLVEIKFPDYNNKGNNKPWALQVCKREDLEKLIKNLDLMIADLKNASEQMKVVEPPITKKSK
jgi:hypothetical protein